jgi:hypothetical protein
MNELLVIERLVVAQYNGEIYKNIKGRRSEVTVLFMFV